MQSHYACAMPTFQARVLRFCTTVKVLKGLNFLVLFKSFFSAVGEIKGGQVTS